MLKRFGGAPYGRSHCGLRAIDAHYDRLCATIRSHVVSFDTDLGNCLRSKLRSHNVMITP